MTDTPAPASPAATEMAAIDALAEASSPVTWAAENLSLEDRDWLRGQLRSIARTEFERLADLGFTLIPTPDLAALRAERDRLRARLAAIERVRDGDADVEDFALDHDVHGVIVEALGQEYGGPDARRSRVAERVISAIRAALAEGRDGG